MPLDKTAETQVPIQEVIRRRWSPRAFLDIPVEPRKLIGLFEAARWAASASKEQPWAFFVATQQQPKNYEDMLGVLVDFNRWGRGKAPVLVLTLARAADLRKTGGPTARVLRFVGQAAARLSLQATALGLTAHQMAGFDADAARMGFAVPRSEAQSE